MHTLWQANIISSQAYKHDTPFCQITSDFK